jgi:hypothetical protein
MKYLHGHDIFPRDLKYAVPPFIIDHLVFGEFFGYNGGL